MIIDKWEHLPKRIILSHLYLQVCITYPNFIIYLKILNFINYWIILKNSQLCWYTNLIKWKKYMFKCFIVDNILLLNISMSLEGKAQKWKTCPRISNGCQWPCYLLFMFIKSSKVGLTSRQNYRLAIIVTLKWRLADFNLVITALTAV